MSAPRSDLDRRAFAAKLRRMGFESKGGREFSHPEIAGGETIFVVGRRVATRREVVSTLTFLLREARARRRGGRFETTRNRPDWLRSAA